MYPKFRQTFVYILYTFCIQNVYKIFVYKIYSIFRLNTFCIQNFAGIVLLILYKQCIPTFVKMWYKFCIYFIYIWYTSVVYILEKFFIQIVYTVSVGGHFQLMFHFHYLRRLNYFLGLFSLERIKNFPFVILFSCLQVSPEKDNACFLHLGYSNECKVKNVRFLQIFTNNIIY